MENKIEQMEQKLLRWEKWLYACFGSAIIMLAQAFIKASENFMLTDFLSSIEEKVVVPANIPDHYVYVQTAYNFLLSPERYWLWLIVELAALTPAAILAFHSAWRKVPLVKRPDLIAAYLLAAWVNLLVLGAQNPLPVSNAYNFFAFGYLLVLGLGYWWLRRKKEKAEEVFP
jgi:hypothetical protein